MKLTMVLAFCTLFFAVEGQAQEQAVTLTESNTVDIVASDNACVYKDSGSGADTDQNEQTGGLIVRNKSTNGGYHQSWLRFNVSTLAEVKTIYSATLKLYVTAQGNKQLELYALADGGAGETNWKSVLTWNTAPTGVQTLLLGNQNPATAGTIMEFNLTGVINNLVTNDTNGQITFRLWGAQNNYATDTIFAALENTAGIMKPTLTVSADFGLSKGGLIRLR